MDFARLNTVAACQKTRTVIVEINGEPTDIEIDIIGTEAPQARRAMAAVRARMPELEKRRAQLQERTQKVAESSEEYERAIDALAKIDDEVNAVWCRYMAECTVAWRNLDSDGAPIPFSVEKAEELYLQSHYLQAAVLPSVMDRAAFMGNVQAPGAPSSKRKRA